MIPIFTLTIQMNFDKRAAQNNTQKLEVLQVLLALSLPTALGLVVS